MSAARDRRRTAMAVLAAWTAVALMLTAHSYFSGHVRGEAVDVARAFGTWLAWAWTWAVLTPGALAVQRRARGRHAWWVHLAAAPLFAVANLALFALVAPVLGANNAAGTWSGTLRNLLGSAFVINVPLYLLVVGIAQGLDLARAARERALRAVALEHQLAEARLMTLRAQLNPHFLFNALNTIAVLMRENVDHAERVLFALAALLRTVLASSSVPFARVEEEYALARKYLEVEKARFGDRLEFRFDASPEAVRALLPSLMLQPLVENCVQHAAGAKVGATTIGVAAHRQGDRLRLVVTDDGPGLSPPGREGVGLANTRARLALLYPDDHAFTVQDAPGGGVEAALTIPYRTTHEDPHADR